MAKNRHKGGSTSKTDSIRELLREHPGGENDVETTLENPATEASTPTINSSMPSESNEAAARPGTVLPPMSRPQFNTWATAYILADCAIQRDASGVYDVLARNFADSGMLSWWLQRIGHADMTKLGRRKDLFDYLRLVSNALHRELKRDLDRPVARM
ncbi:MAG: hypothetical protein WBG50_13000 [Desulfomonilaceae bacterium]